jgi:hypothetical protein
MCLENSCDESQFYICDYADSRWNLKSFYQNSSLYVNMLLKCILHVYKVQ